MPIKTGKSTPPDVREAASYTEGRVLSINPAVDRRLTEFMAVNQRSTDYYRQLVKEDPERAVRSIMLPRMLKHEGQMKLVEQQLPQVKEWVEQTPGMLERIMDRIKNVNPFYKEKAFVNEAKRAKMRTDFAPHPATGPRVSV